jgi:hypothetical protein
MLASDNAFRSWLCSPQLWTHATPPIAKGGSRLGHAPVRAHG